jgi:hypothetical protein
MPFIRVGEICRVNGALFFPGQCEYLSLLIIAPDQGKGCIFCHKLSYVQLLVVISHLALDAIKLPVCAARV